jgi:ABC-type lipoprotein release transport system permease subunit
VNARNPLILSVVVALLATVSLLACYLSGRQAARVNPLVALRYEQTLAVA